MKKCEILELLEKVPDTTEICVYRGFPKSVKTAKLVKARDKENKSIDVFMLFDKEEDLNKFEISI
jgi:hypothetical protein